MQPCPDRIFGEALVVFWAIVGPDVQHTGNTRHSVDGRVIGPASGLAICATSNGNGVVLFSCDTNWEYMTDTWHRTVEEAQRQAEFEYAGLTWQSKS
jgi:hypothetical protein